MGKNNSLRMALMLATAGLAMAGGCTNFVASSRNADGVTLFQRGQYQEAGFAVSPIAWRGPRPAIASVWSGTRIIATATAGWRCC